MPASRRSVHTCVNRRRACAQTERTEMARAMIIDKNAEKYLWPYTIMYTAHILNRISNKAINNKVLAARAKMEVNCENKDLWMGSMQFR